MSSVLLGNFTVWAETRYWKDFFFFKEVYGLFGGEGNGTPLQSSCLENPTDGGAW